MSPDPPHPIVQEAEATLREADAVLDDVDRRQTDRRWSSDKIACPACGSLRSRVRNHHQTVQEERSAAYWRNRQCLDCEAVYETAEYATRILVASPKQKYSAVRTI